MKVDIQKNKRIVRLIIALGLVSLLLAMVAGLVLSKQNSEDMILSYYNFETEIERLHSNPPIYKVHFSQAEGSICYLAVTQAEGYGGVLTVGTVIDHQGQIKEVNILEHQETPSFLFKVLNRGFPNVFLEKHIADIVLENEKVDGISGATLTSQAIAKAVAQGSIAVGNNLLGYELSLAPAPWQFGINELLVLGLYSWALLGLLLRKPRFRYVSLFLGAIILGFYLNQPISISNLASLLLGFLPSIRTRILWWFLVAGTLLITFLLGRNLYCYWLCPFGAVQELLAKIGGTNLRLSKETLNYLRPIKYFLTWFALMVALLTTNASLVSYEPFAVMFGLQGLRAQWLLLPLVLITSMFVFRFWCRFFCPVGVILELVYKLRRKLTSFMGGTKWVFGKNQ